MRAHRRRVNHRLVAVIASLAIIGAACGDDDDDATPPATEAETPATEPATTEPETPETTEPETTEPETTEPETTEPAPETTEFQAPERGDADLVIWADDTRAPVLRPIAEQFAGEEGVAVEVLEVPFDRIRDNLSVAGQAGEGPDIIIGAHDWLGELVANGAIDPIDLGPSVDDYATVAIEAFTYDGQLYGLPYAVENIALVRNTDLVADPPATFEDLEATALALEADGTISVPLAIQQNPGDPYHNYPLFSAAGGYVFGQNDDGSYDPSDVGIDSPGGLAAAELFSQWSGEGLISRDVDYDVMIDTFSRGEAPFAITGPWAIGSFEDAGVNFVVEPIPPVAGGTPEVFVGVQGFMISAFSENPELATTFLVDYLNTEELQLDLFEAGGRPPAMTSAFDQVSDDPIIEGFGLAGQQGTPLPANPEMAAVWTAWTDGYDLIFGGGDPVDAFTSAAATIRDTIAGG